jgi:hypothetical protein
MIITVSVEETELEGDYGSIPGVIVTCDRCGMDVEVYGTSENSIKRGCIMLKEQCDENNFYSYD